MPGGVLPGARASAARVIDMSGRVSGPRSAVNDAFYWCGLSLIGAAVACGLFKPLAAMTRWVPLDPNEGWNAFFAQIAMRGGDLYPAPGSLIINNYPPLSFYIVGAVGRLTGDNIVAGRLVALMSMLAVIVNVYVWMRATGSRVRAASLAAGLTAAFALTYASAYAVINDPQWLGHAIMTTGMVVIWRGNANTRAILLGSLLMLMGGWTKHLLVPLPIATTWWLMRRSTTKVTIWLLWSALLLVVSALLVAWLYGGAFFDSLHSAREYSVHQAAVHTRRALKCFAPLLLLALALLPFARRSERAEFAVVYLIVAGLVAAFTSGGIGVDINAYFDLMIAASLCAALAVEALWEWRLPGRPAAPDAGPVLTLLLGGYVALYAASLFPGSWREWRALDALEQQTLTATRLIAAAGPERAACETPELCYWAKKEFVLDFFNYGQRLKVGKQPLTACAAVLDGKYISLVQLDPNKGAGSVQLPPSCNATIQQNYHPILRSTLGVVLTSVAPGR